MVRSTSMAGLLSPQGGYKNKKFSPSAGARIWFTRFHPDCRQERHLFGPVTRPTVRLTLRRFQGHAREWFWAVEAGTGSQSLACSPCQLPGRLLVPVNALIICVGGIGLEPTTFAMSTQCSNQLSYPPGQKSIINASAQKWQVKFRFCDNRPHAIHQSIRD